MDVQQIAGAANGSSDQGASNSDVTSATAAPAVSSNSTADAQAQQHSQPSNSPIAAVVAKIYNVPSGPSGEPPQLNISYKYVSQLQLVVTVFTNSQTGEEVAQFPPQELLGVAEFFDQVDGVTLDRKV
jgi:uncharacterized FlaG/YvyC family protein